mmetsp:Transcript_25228/g.42300  ORF Transcript_25228/g.42300 Transcript_25228/m.42300 type:complete len:225 (+) Transcript_25228:825-1499(+)
MTAVSAIGSEMERGNIDGRIARIRRRRRRNQEGRKTATMGMIGTEMQQRIKGGSVARRHTAKEGTRHRMRNRTMTKGIARRKRPRRRMDAGKIGEETRGRSGREATASENGKNVVTRMSRPAIEDDMLVVERNWRWLCERALSVVVAVRKKKKSVSEENKKRTIAIRKGKVTIVVGKTPRYRYETTIKGMLTGCVAAITMHAAITWRKGLVATHEEKSRYATRM